MRNVIRLFAILATVIVSVACGKSGGIVSPTPTPTPTPMTSSVTLFRGPDNGMTSSYGYVLGATVHYTLGQDAANAFVMAWSCLSVDGETFAEGGCSGKPVDGTGTASLTIGLPSGDKGQITSTHWILSYLVIGNPSNGQILASEKVARDINYQ